MMTKGKFGLSTAAIAVIAFTFAVLRQPQSVLLVCGFALLAEKDVWLNKQALQALLLTIVYYLTVLVTDWVFGGLARFFRWVEIYGAHYAMNTVNSFIGDVVYLALIVFSVIAILRVLRGRDAGLPYLSKLAGGDLAAALVQKPKTAAPSTRTAPVQTPSASAVEAEPAPAVRLCPACSAPLQEGSRFCTECGAKAE